MAVVHAPGADETGGLALAEAVMQKEFRGVADPEQAWILGELIRYLEHRKSGALDFDDMGEAWVGIRDQVAAGTLRASDKGIAEVVARFDALLRFASLQLGRQLGTEVVPVPSRKEATDPMVHIGYPVLLMFLLALLVVDDPPTA